MYRYLIHKETGDVFYIVREDEEGVHLAYSYYNKDQSLSCHLSHEEVKRDYR